MAGPVNPWNRLARPRLAAFDPPHCAALRRRRATSRREVLAMQPLKMNWRPCSLPVSRESQFAAVVVAERLGRLAVARGAKAGRGGAGWIAVNQGRGDNKGNQLYYDAVAQCGVRPLAVKGEGEESNFRRG